MKYNNEWYEKAVVCLCGNFNMTEAVLDCYNFLKTVVPITRLSVGRTLEDTTDVIANCDDSGIFSANEQFIHSPRVYNVILESKISTNELNGASGVVVEHIDHPIVRILNAISEKTKQYVIPPFLFLRIMNNNKFTGGVLFYYNENKPFSPEERRFLASLRTPFTLMMDNAFQHLELKKYNDKIVQDNIILKQGLSQQKKNDIIGKETGLKDVFAKVAKAAPLDIDVLITGETGTGKDIIAKAIHEQSKRKKGPFIAVNCGAIPSSLIESALFGHTKGAFTGAVQSMKGYFERADMGTLFLDEIGELPIESQARLLRTLQDGMIVPLGSEKEVYSNFRLISATNQNLHKKISEGSFREDLYFRLCELSIMLPPLRERKEDIPELAHFFIDKFAEFFGLSHIEISQQEMNKLLNYYWPGNVRELQNVIKSAIATLTGKNLVFNLSQVQSKIHFPEEKKFPSFDQLQTEYFTMLLKKTKGKINGSDGAANLAGLEPNTLRSRLLKLNIPYKKSVL